MRDARRRAKGVPAKLLLDPSHGRVDSWHSRRAALGVPRDNSVAEAAVKGEEPAATKAIAELAPGCEYGRRLASHRCRLCSY